MEHTTGLGRFWATCWCLSKVCTLFLTHFKPWQSVYSLFKGSCSFVIFIVQFSGNVQWDWWVEELLQPVPVLSPGKSDWAAARFRPSWSISAALVWAGWHWFLAGRWVYHCAQGVAELWSRWFHFLKEILQRSWSLYCRVYYGANGNLNRFVDW